MFEASIFAAITSWFTPTILFLLLNLMIGTIIITSIFHQNTHQNPNPHLARSPSVLQRLKSINFYSYRSQEPTPNFDHKSPEIETHYSDFSSEQTHLLTRSPSLLQKLKAINFSPAAAAAPAPADPSPETHFPDQHPDQEKPTLDEIYSKLTGTHVSRTKSDTEPASGKILPKLSKKMKKSASVKSAFGHFLAEEDDVVVEKRRPASVREGKVTVAEADDEVDAKADDFINKFKQELKLQRLDSFVRYRELINRGSGK